MVIIVLYCIILYSSIELYDERVVLSRYRPTQKFSTGTVIEACQEGHHQNPTSRTAYSTSGTADQRVDMPIVVAFTVNTT